MVNHYGYVNLIITLIIPPKLELVQKSSGDQQQISSK